MGRVGPGEWTAPFGDTRRGKTLAFPRPIPGIDRPVSIGQGENPRLSSLSRDRQAPSTKILLRIRAFPPATEVSSLDFLRPVLSIHAPLLQCQRRRWAAAVLLLLPRITLRLEAPDPSGNGNGNGGGGGGGRGSGRHLLRPRSKNMSTGHLKAHHQQSRVDGVCSYLKRTSELVGGSVIG
ncbi:uncharacterized protein [Triticum aestivum]|uniref:uncharacterized protein n=1 Tax=Triticum aestivum TaxID=4565 RepID=UPI001D0271B0|nr:uncharacterized protein LOC123067347 [Triticum aestivum]